MTKHLKKVEETPEREANARKQEELPPSLHPMLAMQQLVGNRAVAGLLESRAWVQTKLRDDPPLEEFEHEVDVSAPHLISARKPVIQRKCATCTPTSKCSECEEEETRVHRKAKDSPYRAVQLKSKSTAPVIQRAPRNGNSTATTPPATTSEPAISTAGPLIVDDDAATLSPGQMHQTEFLEQLRGAVCATADEALAEAGQSTQGCPYIEKWLGYYQDQPPSHVERALLKFAPEAATAASARDYIPAISNRVRQGVLRWASTGEVPDLPDELKEMFGGGSVIGAIGGALGGIGSAIGGAISAAVGAIGGAVSSIGKALFKQKEGHTESATNDANEIQSRLSDGQPLDAGAKSRMGAALGYDFSAVRVHTDGNAAGLSDQLSARAFTVGSDIAFGAGEYQPGTMIGDALIAHELAHVVQQQGGLSRAERATVGQSPSLETEADDAAVDAVLSVHAGDGFARPRSRRRLSELKTGLRLQKCGAGPYYSDTELQAFVTKLGSKGVQRGFYDDDRARGVVKRWRENADDFKLNAQIKYLLIQTLLDGATGGDDERAILDLLEFSVNADLRDIFATMGLRPDELDKKFDGDNRKELLAFYSERFEGGRAALVKGVVTPKGEPERSGAMTHDEMMVARAKKLIPMYEKYIEEWNVFALRQQAREKMLESREKIEDPIAAAQGRPAIEAGMISGMNRKPLKIDASGEDVIFRVKFHARFLDKNKRNFPSLKSAVESAAAERWSKDISEVMEGKKRFELITEVTEVALDAPRDHNYWLIEVRATDTDPVEHPGCTLDQPSVPAGVTDLTCDGGLMSLPPKSTGDSDLIAHEMLHLFGLIDRYMMYVHMKPGDKEVDRVVLDPMRETPDRLDLLGGEKAPILDEDLAFLFEKLGVYRSELYRGLEVLPVLQKQGMGLREVELDLERQKEIVSLGYDPRSLVRTIIRPDFLPELRKMGEDL